MERRFPNARRQLEAVEEGRLRVARLRRELQYLEERCRSTTQSYAERNGGSRDVHSVLWDQLADKKELLACHQQILEQKEEEVSRRIDLVPHARWRMVLRCKYLNGMDLTDVAEEMRQATGRPFSMNQIYRFHSMALGALEKLEEENRKT